MTDGNTTTEEGGEWERASHLLDRLLDLPAAARAEELTELRRSEPELADRVESYLRRGSELDGFLDRPLLCRPPERSVRMAAGERIGPFEIVRCIGFGGMGEVYLGRRVDDFEQRVAIKVLRRGKSTADWLLRFERERQLLARLAHHNIAGLLDGGRTSEGLPYLVMEFVDGLAVDRFVRDRDLSARQSLKLFLKICKAVAYLHRNLVVHRDLKPSNVLVTAEGEPILVDFGIAKSLGNEEVDPTITKEVGPPRTLLFSSPEQVRGRPISTVSDVYAMGVLLSVMLTGEPPYGRPRGEIWSRDELERAICKEPALSLNQIVATDSSSHRFSPDLDSVVLKALDKEPEERYESVEALAEDLRRYLEGRPVRAHHGGLLYRARKFLRTNRVAVIVGSLILVLAAVSSVSAWRAARERDAAIRARAQAHGYVAFLEGLFKEAAPDRSGSKDISAIDMLDRGRRELLRTPSEDSPPPRQLADLSSSIGAIYRQHGEYGKAAELLDWSIDHWRRIVADADATKEDNLRLAQVLNQRSGVAYRQGYLEEADVLITESLEIRQQLGFEPQDLAPAINNLATIRLQRGRHAEAENGYLEALAIRRRAFGEQSVEVAASYYVLGVLEFDRRDLEKAERLLRRSLDLRLDLDGPRHTQVATVRSSLGRVLQEQGRLRDAEKEFRTALTLRQELLSPDHQDLALSKRDIAAVLVDLGQPATAQVLAREALESLRKSAPNAEFWIATTESVLGASLLKLNRFDEAEAFLKDSRDVIGRLRGPRSIYAQRAIRRVEELLEARKRSAQSN